MIKFRVFPVSRLVLETKICLTESLCCKLQRKGSKQAGREGLKIKLSSCIMGNMGYHWPLQCAHVQ